MSGLAGAVLAGGKASRFGSDKTRLTLNGRSLSSHLLGIQARAGLDPLFLCADSAPADLPPGVRLLPDHAAGQGPLGALATLLEASDRPVLVLAGDMPGVQLQTLEALITAWRPGTGGVVAQGVDGPHPLLAIYEPGLRGSVEAALSSGRRSLRDWIRGAGLPGWTLPDPSWAENINRPEDWARWVAAQKRGPKPPRA